MPYTRYARRNFGRFRRRRRYGRRVGAPLGRAPRWGRRMRVAQGLTRNVFWFKVTGGVPSGAAGRIFQRYAPNQITFSTQFNRYGYLYESYKILKMIVKFYPANVGAEHIQGPAPILGQFERGNILTYIDQPPIAAAAPANINEVMSLPSSRIAQPRRFIKRYINRPRGGRTNVWPLIDHVAGTGAPAFQADPWDTEIRIFGDNFAAAGTQPFFFYEQLFKCVFRSRYQV